MSVEYVTVTVRYIKAAVNLLCSVWLEHIFQAPEKDALEVVHLPLI